MNDMSTAEIARKALKILDRDGWSRGVSGGPGEPHCLGGCWNAAVHGRNWDWTSKDTYQPLVNVIREQYPEWRGYNSASPAGTVISWNDHVAASEADVRAILEKLAAGGHDE